MNTKTVDTDGTIIEFLNGSHSYEGVWFGDKHRTKEGTYWWRKILRDYIEASQFQHPVPAKEYPIGGYAPGNYMCNCTTCKAEFFGDKLAVQCESCAIKMAHPVPDEAQEGKGWISVEGRLPEIKDIPFSDSAYVLCIDMNFGGVPFVAWYNHEENKWTVSHHNATSDAAYVTHWQPLPAVLTTVHDADFKPENIVAISSNGTTHNLNILTMGNTKQIKTAKEIILQFANEHSYESWGELMYDTHEPVQVDYTKQVMELYHAQFQHPVPDASHPAGNDAVKFWEWVKKQIEICDSEELNAKFLIMHDTKSVREYWKGKRDALKEIKSWQP